jgi:ABC-type transporter Mla subunit MlaD
MNADGRKTSWLTTGLLLALTAVLVAALFYGVAHNPFRRSYLSFSIRFDDVSGIHERSKVNFLGIPVGYVKQLNYCSGESELAVDVEVVITRKLNIPANVRAYLEPTLLGESTISLRPIEQESLAKEDSREVAQNSPNAGLLVNGTQISGRRSTRLEAVLPGFDQAMTDAIRFGAAAKEDLSDTGKIVDKAVTTLSSIFLQVGPNGRTDVESLIVSLNDVINGPAGQHDQSVCAQLKTIVRNLQISSESIKQLVDLPANGNQSLGRVLQRFEEAATNLSRDAEAGELLIRKIGHASDNVVRASQQISALGIKATVAVDEFHSRPFHYLTTTRRPSNRERTQNVGAISRD